MTREQLNANIMSFFKTELAKRDVPAEMISELLTPLPETLRGMQSAIPGEMFERFLVLADKVNPQGAAAVFMHIWLSTSPAKAKIKLKVNNNEGQCSIKSSCPEADIRALHVLFRHVVERTGITADALLLGFTHPEFFNIKEEGVIENGERRIINTYGPDGVVNSNMDAAIAERLAKLHELVHFNKEDD